MSDLSYLKDPVWLSAREKQWDTHKAQWLYDFSKKEVELRRSYFFDGDIDLVIGAGDKFFTLHSLIWLSPFDDIQPVLKNISKYWAWVLKDPEKRDYWEHIKDLDERFIYQFNCILCPKDDSLHPNVSKGLFFWLYGNTFEKDRCVVLTDGEPSITIPVSFDVNDQCFYLLNGILNCLWRNDTTYDLDVFKSFIPYFLSIYPHMSPMCFSTLLPEEREFFSEDREKYKQSWFFSNRWLLTMLNGYITEYEEEEDIEELVCNDHEALKQLKDGLNNLKMPPEFYRLQEFVLKHKGDSLYASED